MVDACEHGVARVTGHIFTVDSTKFAFFRRPEPRTRIISLHSGDVLVNIVPPAVNLERVTYKMEKKSIRVTDGGDWYMDISEFAWR